MNSGYSFMRNVFLLLAVLFFAGGYAAHQYFLFQGPDALAKWSAAIAEPLIPMSWLFFIGACLLALLGRSEIEK